MGGWQWFWTLVLLVVYIVVLIFLYFFEPFRLLFTRVINGISFSNISFWVAIIIGMVGFCAYHWHAYRHYIVRGNNVDQMVLGSLRGSSFIGILLSGGAALQALQLLCVHVLETGYALDAAFGQRLAALLTLVVVTGVFYIIFWLLSLIGAAAQGDTPRQSGQQAA